MPCLQGWERGEVIMLKAKYSGKLAAFPGAPECHVLENGRRVITQIGGVKCLTAKSDEEGGCRKAGDLRVYISRLPSKYKGLNLDANFVDFETQEGYLAVGIDAEVFVDVLSAYVQLDEAGLLRENQLHLASNARRAPRRRPWWRLRRRHGLRAMGAGRARCAGDRCHGSLGLRRPAARWTNFQPAVRVPGPTGDRGSRNAALALPPPMRVDGKCNSSSVQCYSSCEQYDSATCLGQR